MSNIYPLPPFAEHPTILRVDDRQRLARERREEREKQLGKASSIFFFFFFNGLSSACNVFASLLVGAFSKLTVLDTQ